MEKKFAGGQFLAPYADIEDDKIQMGGDVLLSKSGNIEFIHRSENPADRTACPKILNILKEKKLVAN